MLFFKSLVLLFVFVNFATIALGDAMSANEIYVEWERRQSLARNIQCSIHTVVSYLAESKTAMETLKPYPENDTELKMDYFLVFEGPSRFRSSRKGKEFDFSTGNLIERNYQNGWLEGKRKNFLAKSHHGEDSSEKKYYPIGFIDEKPLDWDNIHLLPVLTHFIPINPYFCPTSTTEYEVNQQSIDIAGKLCFPLQPATDDGKPMYVFYVSPSQNFSILGVDNCTLGKQL